MSTEKACQRLLDIEDLRRLCQSLAVLDAILCPEWEYRYFSFNATWASGEMLASMRNGEGDDWLILWSPHGAIVKGFAHGAPMARGCPWAGVLDNVPQEFQDFLNDPAFSRQQTTFCLWRRADDTVWRSGEIDYPQGADPDGALNLLRFLDGDPATYLKWGEEYFGSRLDERAVEHIYRQDPLSRFVVRALNPDATYDELKSELEEIGYPA